MSEPVNPFNLPTPAPGEIAPVSMDSFAKMADWEQDGCGDASDPESPEEEAAEGNFMFNTSLD